MPLLQAEAGGDWLRDDGAGESGGAGKIILVALAACEDAATPPDGWSSGNRPENLGTDEDSQQRDFSPGKGLRRPDLAAATAEHHSDQAEAKQQHVGGLGDRTHFDVVKIHIASVPSPK